jgi:ferredoxin
VSIDHKPLQTVIFWGAGATASLGMSITAKQAEFIHCLADAGKEASPLRTRVDNALGSACPPRWRDALYDLITILGDDQENDDGISSIDDDERAAMRRSFPNAGDDKAALDERILGLRLFYDWPALKSVVRICPGVLADNFKIQDLFNLMDLHIPSGLGFRTQAKDKSIYFLDTRRLVGAKNALSMLLGALFYIDYQECLRTKQDALEQYKDFASRLGERMQREGKELARKCRLDEHGFYLGDVAFVSLNYDPIALWIQFIANRELNKNPHVPHIGSPAVPLHLFHDFGHMIPARRIGRNEKTPLWYPLNEAVAQRLNEASVSDCRVRLTKFLFPHGCLCWRECPNCGKLSAYHGEEWKLDAEGLFPPPPLKVFDDRPCPKGMPEDEQKERDERDRVDARACLHCGQMTYAHQTQTIMQSQIKPHHPSFIEEIQRDLRATMLKAKHFIFMGYSLPTDDFVYRAIFSAMRERGGREDKEKTSVRCTIIGKEAKYPGWHGPSRLEKMKDVEVVKSACDIFSSENVRYYGNGCPDVFLENDRATDSALEKLLNWDE